jgi:hypothetical protein
MEMSGMKLRARNGLLLLVTAALVVVSGGCPNSTSITAGVGKAQLAINLVNPSRFDFGFFNIDRILVRPVDADASQITGTDRDITVLPFGAFIDTNVPMVDPLFLDSTPLSQGVYEVVEIRLSSISFSDSDPTDPSTCESSIANYFPPTGPPVGTPVAITSFAMPLQFTILDAQETMITLTFDITQMISTLHNAYTCSTCFPGPFCVRNFSHSQFAAGTLDYLTFN